MIKFQIRGKKQIKKIGEGRNNWTENVEEREKKRIGQKMLEKERKAKKKRSLFFNNGG